MSRQSAAKDLISRQERVELPNEIWNLTEVMSFLKVSRTAIYELMKSDGLPYVQIGKYRKFDPRDVAAWWERKRRHGQIAS